MRVVCLEVVIVKYQFKKTNSKSLSTLLGEKEEESSVGVLADRRYISLHLGILTASFSEDITYNT
jgi:hypothetical protein